MSLFFISSGTAQLQCLLLYVPLALKNTAFSQAMYLFGFILTSRWFLYLKHYQFFVFNDDAMCVQWGGLWIFSLSTVREWKIMALWYTAHSACCVSVCPPFYTLTHLAHSWKLYHWGPSNSVLSDLLQSKITTWPRVLKLCYLFRSPLMLCKNRLFKKKFSFFGWCFFVCENSL